MVVLPSDKLSSTPVRVTVCGVFQLLLVKVRLSGEAITSLVLSELICRTTLLEGWLVSITVKLSVVPFSLTSAVVFESDKQGPVSYTHLTLPTKASV